MKTPREILLKRHRSVEPKLDRLWADSLAPAVAAVCDRRKTGQECEVGAHRAPLQGNVLFAAGWKLWRELIWPNRHIWAGLGCAWLLIIALNVASYEPKTQVVSKAAPPSREEMRALIEQRQLLAQMIGLVPEPAGRRKSHPSGPRSERAGQILAA